jgi:perosamine synthetase
MAIPYGRQAVDERDVEAVLEVLRGDWLTQGPEVRRFEEAFAAACEAPYAVAFSSGTAALHGAAFAAELTAGDDLLTSAITFSASANCGAYLGATPRFADIEPATWNVSADTIRQAITPATSAVIPVHFAGLPAPVREIREAVGEDVAIIEDAAHALGANTQEERIGSCRHTDMAIFSLHPLKAITTAEGGIVTTRSEELRERLESFRNHGFALDPERLRRTAEGGWYREQQVLGLNYRLSDIHSALGRSQLGKLDDFIAARNRVADRYRDWLGDVDALELPPEAPAGTLHAYHLFVIWHREGREGRRRLYDRLRAEDVFPQVHYLPVYLHPYYQDVFGYEEGLCPEAERYYHGCLSLPCFPTLSEEDQRRVVEVIRDEVAA